MAIRAKSETALPEVMTVKGLAHYLRVHPTTVYRMLRAGELPGFRVGSDWRFNKDTIDAWMRKETSIALSAGLHVQVNGRAKRLDQRVGRRADRVDEVGRDSK